MEIRQETPGDYGVVREVVHTAFESAEHSDGNEHELVGLLRESGSFVPELSLVAVEDDIIVGHIMFTEVRIGGSAELALAPLSVLPAYQKRGIGSALMQAGHDAARKLGYGYSIVLGDPGYYRRAGYVPASCYGIIAPFDVADENFMALRLRDDAGAVRGAVSYDAAFGI